MNSLQQTAYNNDDEISLVDLAVLLVKRWKLMLAIFLLVMLAAAAYALTRPTSYTYTSLYAMAEPSLLIATLAIRGVFTVDRYWVQAISGAEILAAYVLFAGVANSVMSFLDSGVFVFLYHKIISAFKRKDSEGFSKG